ncbi:F-box protein SKIP16 isoform X6 [Quercus lobata]|uniref:F-box protein SKIP16 isoform X6 n=1 Tax=Quercus lobata TaxID=97700 RepID=UPI001246BD83|nr:F-box protein SKIP16 isoform X6 [Quercus lobata]
MQKHPGWFDDIVFLDYVLCLQAILHNACCSLQLMTSWAVVCNVWYLELQYIKPGETAIELAERLWDIISVRAGLKKVPWDGYLNYSRHSPKHRDRKTEKFFFLNCTTGQLHVGTVNLATEGEMIPCVPNALISSVHDSNGDQQQDAMLLWLEEHACRLENGMIKLREERGTRSISLFPEEPPFCSTAITNGVKVRASAVFVPEIADLQNENAKYTSSYSIRMSLQREGCIINGIPFSSCQLKWRHWIIRANDHVESDFNGEAVIGKYPLLLPGEREFVYESCTPLPTSLGSIEGSFTFVPGRLADPKGAPFEVEVARFPLQLPDYIF